MVTVLWAALLKQTENQMPCGPIKPAGNECLLDFLPIKKKQSSSQRPPVEKTATYSVNEQHIYFYYLCILFFRVIIFALFWYHGFTQR